MKFATGRHLLTRGAALVLAPFEASTLIQRHVDGDWRDLCTEDMEANEWSIENGARVLSKYEVRGHWFYVITEADRSSTTVLLVDEY